MHPGQAKKLSRLETEYTAAKQNEHGDPALYRKTKKALAKYRIALRKELSDTPDGDGDAIAATSTIKASTKDPRKKGT